MEGDLPQAVLTQVTCHMDDGPAQVQEFPLVHCSVLTAEEPGRSAHLGIADEAGLHQVDLGLGTAAHVHIAVAAGTSLDGEEGVEFIGIPAVVIEARLRHGRPDHLSVSIQQRLQLILRGEQHRVPQEFAVVEQAVLPVVDLHHRGLPGGIHPVVI